MHSVQHHTPEGALQPPDASKETARAIVIPPVTAQI